MLVDFLWRIRYYISDAWRYITKDIPKGVRNVVMFFPLIWRDRDWDWYYVADILKFKLEKMHKYRISSGIMCQYEGGERDTETIKECIDALNDMFEADAYNFEYFGMEKDGDTKLWRKQFKKCDKIKEDSLKKFCEVFRKNLFFWWD